jgi:hypothetical protein
MTKLKAKELYSHFRINKKPTNSQEIQWIEACVSHLGIKILWLKNWSKLADALNLMIE